MEDGFIKMNIWLERFKNKIFTFEISKNAMYRLHPVVVDIIEKKKNHIIIDCNVISKNSLINLACLVDEINHDNSRRYYGRTKVYYDKKEISSSLLREIKNIKISCGDPNRDIPEDHVLLSVYYED